MVKIKTKFKRAPLILPVCLVGALVKEKPNFQAIAWFNMVDYDPYLIGFSSEKSHYTNKGIKENKTFSVNIPNSKMASVTDFCGLYSGADVDKSKIFNVFYGELKTAPMIGKMPINIECKLTKTINSHNADFFIGEIKGVYIDDNYLINNKPDMKSIDPLLYEDGVNNYWILGKYLTKAFDIGKKFKPKEIN
jgi:flavin reductase (DIM6/NTAB) family NADH-FMN oxidoreductase RutF